MSADKNKPTLNNLFESKKLDLPQNDFWEKFQNDVKGQVFASVSRPSISHRILKSTLFALPIFILVIFASQKNYLGYESKDSSEIIKISDEAALSSEDNVQHNRFILQSLEESEYDVLVTNTDLIEIDLETSSYYEKTLKLEQPDSFETQFLNNNEYRQDDQFARFTF